MVAFLRSGNADVVRPLLRKFDEVDQLRKSHADEMYQTGPTEGSTEKPSLRKTKKKKKKKTPKKKAAMTSSETLATVRPAEGRVIVTSSETSVTVTSPERCGAGRSTALAAEATIAPPMKVKRAGEDGFVAPKPKKRSATESVEEVAPVPQRNHGTARRPPPLMLTDYFGCRMSGLSLQTSQRRSSQRISRKTEVLHHRLSVRSHYGEEKALPIVIVNAPRTAERKTFSSLEYLLPQGEGGLEEEAQR